MRLHHLGYACINITDAIQTIKKNRQVISVGEIIFDPVQNVKVCMITIKGGMQIELVSGDIVKSYIKDSVINFYHTCYEAENFWEEYDRLKYSDAILLLEPCPAKLFNDRLICFFQTESGVIELLDAHETNHERTAQCDINEYDDHSELLILANYNVQQQTNIIASLLKKLHLNLSVACSNNEDLIIEILNPQSIFYQAKSPFAVTIFLSLSNLDKTIISEYLSALREALINATERVKCPFFLVFMPDKSNALHENKSKIIEFLQNIPLLTLIDNATMISGRGQILDEYLSILYNAPYTSHFESQTAQLLIKSIHREFDTPFKIIAVDADDTLWDGVCAENSLSDIKIAEHNRKLQSFLLDCKKKGFIICIVSKNTPEDVFHIINHHPDILLKMEDIADCEINWNSKAENMCKLSSRLNIGLDSFVFIDNSQNECIDVEKKLPQILTICLSEGFNLIEQIRNLWIFEESNAEAGISRTSFYQENSARLRYKEKHNSYIDYLKMLNSVVDFLPLKKNVDG